MSLDLSFHNITTLSAVAKTERHAQYVDLKFIAGGGEVSEITIHFDAKAKADKFAAMINLAAMLTDPGKTLKACEQMRQAHAESRAHTAAVEHRSSHPDAFAIEDDFQHDYDDERQHGWAAE